MWVIFGNRTKAQPVPGGRSQDQDCPRCKIRRQFIECDVADEVSIFFVPVLSGSTRRMVCTTCGEDLNIEPSSARLHEAAPPAAPKDALPTQRPTERELEEQLRALKKRMKG